MEKGWTDIEIQVKSKLKKKQLKYEYLMIRILSWIHLNFVKTLEVMSAIVIHCNYTCYRSIYAISQH